MSYKFLLKPGLIDGFFGIKNSITFSTREEFHSGLLPYLQNGGLPLMSYHLEIPTQNHDLPEYVPTVLIHLIRQHRVTSIDAPEGFFNWVQLAELDQILANNRSLLNLKRKCIGSGAAVLTLGVATGSPVLIAGSPLVALVAFGRELYIDACNSVYKHWEREVVLEQKPDSKEDRIAYKSGKAAAKGYIVPYLNSYCDKNARAATVKFTSYAAGLAEGKKEAYLEEVKAERKRYR